jgi:uncharacterized protein (DUF983 family)
MSLWLAIMKITATGFLFVSVIQSAEWKLRPPFWQEMVFFLLPNLIILGAIWL